MSIPLSELESHAGRELGVSDWYPLTQEVVDQFAEATRDFQWIHVDPVRAADGPFGGPIAHGMLTLSMLPAMVTDTFAVDGADLIINKGFDKVRLGKPVPVGSRVRGAVRLTGVRPRPKGYTEVTLGVSVEVESAEGAALTAEMIFLYHAEAA
ncbi:MULTISPECIES: MaoC family dehydratase [Actinokineospora]|uniref:Enoyl-CoA hydratase 1 n=1 Tax=Actinokineospora fastidiosa TaxID=1816 RepID=A0A918G860_9PSEU|nr:MULTISPECIES: MaoC family dehydratase [Actinokineospora]UVS81981.1 putative enoyl-CoA hydratase 1 [Actinokineospora sp. UTMC 2448]GGS24394.1 putative enoyl-CoA hydratase 1 [Actinokineospora fastidiosa]